MPPMDHIGLCPADFDASLRFYVDGIGLEVIFDVTLPGDMYDLLGVHTDKVRTCFVGDPAASGSSRLELLQLFPAAPAESPRTGYPQRGLTLVSFVTPVQATLERLRQLGLGGEPRIMPTPAGKLSAMVVDPDGVMVELLDQAVSFG
ncbi:MAG TPA: VOC family protein [Mycobacteriales bacterium]|nr:VOC family protein [Mycobacteriales bacterium]